MHTCRDRTRFPVSLAGVPPLASFYGKYYPFFALLGKDYYNIEILAALYVVISANYYFRMIRACWLGEVAERPASLDMNLGTRMALIGASGVLTELIGTPLQRLIDLAGESAY